MFRATGRRRFFERGAQVSCAVKDRENLDALGQRAVEDQVVAKAMGQG
jgi:hypothetical protein